MDAPRVAIEPEMLSWLLQLPAPVFWLDAEGRVGWCNPAAAALVSDSSLQGKGLWHWFQPAAGPSMGQPRESLLGLPGKRWRWFRCSAAPYKEGRLCVLYEVTQEYSQARAYASSLEVLASLLTQEERLEHLFKRILETAVEVVPGAEAGSLTLFEDGKFRFVAQIGFDDSLKQQLLSYEQERAWYGLDERAWLEGRPRLLLAPEIQRRSAQTVGEGENWFGQMGRVGELQATISVPIVLQGQVMGTLNLDSFTSTEAFPPESLAIAQTFALQAATVLYGLLSRQRLAELALQDALTGLGNRRALEEGFARMKAQAVRLERPLTLIYWDMDGLKRINDQHGHAAGDRALKLLATALRSVLRREDLAFRIGGDEFVSLHLGLSPEEAPEVIRRVRAELNVEVSAGAVGVGPLLELVEALSRADAAMYAEKRRKQRSAEI
ncbi:diguanylate cyclase [Meiothermus sp. QL-1]|uniref:GGDEF domain-containing protein n=1 Tax=Meiothermus sp. QL-1 TaxID=2058095 RepID=UPI000E0A34A1|nr:diguanylate cyclase [Meiothermus sp. QL-1]RDI95722.1 diguanylate cyclase [Meiothermus sp. QL-1]